MKPLSRAELARFIDHTLVRADATREDIEHHCAEAREHGFHGVCVNGSRVEQAYAALEDTNIKVTAMVGFPLGATDGDAKRYEAEVAVDQGAHEVEMVLNIGRLKEGDRSYVLRELRDIAEAADERPVKVALEIGLLTLEQRLLACELALDSGVQFVGTGTGFGAPAGVEDVQSLRASLGPKFGLKAAGGIVDAETALALIEAGATRLGATKSLAIVLGVPK